MGKCVEPQIPLGEAVRLMREEKMLTKAAVASRSGLSARWLLDLETGKGNPSWSNLRRVALGLKVDLTELGANVELAERRHEGRRAAEAGLWLPD
jgi:transcriptional regulator with XRE-family HTH domain